ncbi:MAG: HEAT repeat domain-containing protein [Planctomycetota bacterium]
MLHWRWLNLALILTLLVAGAACSSTDEDDSQTPSEQSDPFEFTSSDQPLNEADVFDWFARHLSSWDGLANLAIQEGDVRRQRVELEKKLGNQALKSREMLISALRNGSPWQQTIAAAALGFLPNRESSRELVPLMLETLGAADDERVIGNLLMSITHIADEDTDVSPIIDKMLKYPSQSVRRNAAAALVALANPQLESQVSRQMMIALEDEDEVVRALAAQALGELHSNIAVGNLIHKLNDGFSIVQREAALALGKIGNPLAVEPLIEKLSSGDPEVQEASTTALLEFSGGVKLETKEAWLQWWDRERSRAMKSQ